MIDKATRKSVFEAAKMPKIEDMLREKRLRWFGHLTREKKGDPAKECLMREMEIDSKWFKLLKKDLLSKNLTVIRAELIALDKPKWRTISSCNTNHVVAPSTGGRRSISKKQSARSSKWQSALRRRTPTKTSK